MTGLTRSVTECGRVFRLPAPARSPNQRRLSVSSIGVYHEALSFLIANHILPLPLDMYKAPSSPRQRPLSRGSSLIDEDTRQLSKRPRLSEEDDEDEDQPLAITARMNIPSSSRFENGARPHPSRRGGKGTSAMSTAHTAPVSIPPPSGD